MDHRRVTLLIDGMNTYLGREVARFGRAMGHRMVGIVDDSIPALEEPWMHGIHWMTDRDKALYGWPEGPPAAIVYTDTALWNGDRRRFEEILVRRPSQWVDSASQLDPPPRFVLRSTIDQPLLSSRFTACYRRTEEVIGQSSLSSAILRFPLLYGPDRPDSVAAMMVLRGLRRIPLGSNKRPFPPPMRVETAALACLRASLEPDLTGLFGPEDIARIGDVMIPQ